MLDRNRRIKKFPEKFQTCTDRFDIIITAEERVYDQVIEFMESKEPVHNQPVHVINMDIQVCVQANRVDKILNPQSKNEI